MHPYTKFVRLRASLMLGAALSLAAVLSACTLTVDVNPGGGGNGGGGAVVTVGASAAVSSSSSGAGAGGGGAVSMYGLGATEFVSAGGLSKSPNYKLVFTLGQPSIQQESASSPGYRMQGGLEGANGSVP